MNSRDNPDMPPAPSYPSPNAAQMGQGTMQYYSNRQLTEDELLSAELSRDASAHGLPDGPSNGVHHGQSMVLGSSGPELGRPSSPDQHHQEHMLQFTPSQQVGVDPNHDLSYGDQSARRKRSKISRACDECRRKKVRCDASSESGVEACSNCRRLGVTCQFSRVPMKRGPSKGYIKELAERLHTLESQMQPGMVNSDMPYQSMGEASPPRNYQDFPSPVEGGSLSRKRTYSVFEGLPSASFTQPPFSSRGPQNAFDTQGTSTDHAIHTNAPVAGNLFWQAANEHDLPSGMEMEEFKPTTDEHMGNLDVDNAAFNAYCAKIHPFVPVLPQSKERLLELMHQCPREVQEAFLYALYAVTHTRMDRVAGAFQKVESFDNAQDLLVFHARNPPVAPVTALNIVWFQAMLLMILDADSRGPDNLTLKSGIPKHTLLLNAGKLGHDLAKGCGQLHSQRASVPDADADANLVRRCWVSLVVLSRWYAISMSDASLMRSEEILGREDAKVLDRGVTAIASYSTFLNDLVALVIDNPNACQSMTGLGRVVGNNMVSAIERLNREDSELMSLWSQEDTASYSFLESLSSQLFWTVRLLMKRHVFVYSPYEIIYCAGSLMDEMHKATMQNRLATPFDLHGLALATMTLLEATVLPEFASECWDGLRKLDDILGHRAERDNTPAEFEGIFGTPGWDAKFRLFTEWRRTKVQESQIQDANLNRRNSSAAPPMGPNEQRSLQHLADLAVGAEGSVAGNASPPPEANTTSPRLAPLQPSGRAMVDFTMLTQKGYLNVFAGLIYSRRSR